MENQYLNKIIETRFQHRKFSILQRNNETTIIVNILNQQGLRNTSCSAAMPVIPWHEAVLRPRPRLRRLRRLGWVAAGAAGHSQSGDNISLPRVARGRGLIAERETRYLDIRGQNLARNRELCRENKSSTFVYLKPFRFQTLLFI